MVKKRTPNVARRLDYILTSSGIFDKTIVCYTESVTLSEHRDCLIHIKFTDVVKGNGWWKFNHSLLDDIGFVTRMKTQIDSFLRENELNSKTLWEPLKVKMKKSSISF